MKTANDYFADWEGRAFGFGYGTGEPHIIGALKQFFDAFEDERSYRYEILEAAVTPPVAWLLINRLCGLDCIEYGVSPRYGWLTKTGERLKRFVSQHSTDELCEMTYRSEDEWACYPDACNCGPEGYEKGRVCQNPFWLESASDI